VDNSTENCNKKKKDFFLHNYGIDIVLGLLQIQRRMVLILYCVLKVTVN